MLTLDSCVVCKQSHWKVGLPGAANDNIQCVEVAMDWQLRRISHVQRLAMATAALDLSRREIPNWVTAEICNHLVRNGRICWTDGSEFPISDCIVDDAFNNDGSYRWLSDFLRFANSAPRQRPQKRVIARLRLIDLAFRISRRNRARLIAE